MYGLKPVPFDLARLVSGLTRLRKKALFHVDLLKRSPQGLKPTLTLLHLWPD